MEHVSPADRERIEAAPGIELVLLADGEHTNVQYFSVAPDAVSESHSHPQEQAMYIFRGELTLTTDEKEVVAGPGDAVVIPGGESHASANNGDEPVEGVDVFSPPRHDPESVYGSE